MTNSWTFVFKDFVDLVNRLVDLVFYSYAPLSSKR